MLIDTHAHLFYPNFEEDLDDVINNARTAGIEYILVPATDLPTSIKTVELCRKYPAVYGAVGVHPHETKDWDPAMIQQIEELAANDKIVAIGEIGLDYHYDFSPKEKQIEAFKAQLELAVKLGKPVVIHNRESDEDMMSIIRDFCGTGLKAQFHCFNGTLEDALELQDMNHFISFTGNITFKKADALNEILSKISLDNLLLETDSPFMTPEPFRGKRNEPSYLKYISEHAAEIHKVSDESMRRITSFNAFRMFGIGSEPHTAFTYKLGNTIYLNITNRCDSDCVFCKRKTEPYLAGYNLRMSKAEEPTSDIYIFGIGDPTSYDEVVFCGFGEPTVRWDVVKEVARYVKSKGGKTRLNTNGHGSYINKRNIVPEMNGLIDTVSISLNSSDPRQYAELMRVETRLFNEMIQFAKSAKSYVDKVVMSVVSIDQVEIDKARKIVEEKIGVEFRVRHYF